MSKEKIEVGDWVRLTGPYWKQTYPEAPEYVQVTEIDENYIYADYVSDVGETETGLYTESDFSSGSAAHWVSKYEVPIGVRFNVDLPALKPASDPATNIPFVEELKALHDPISPNHYDYPGGVQVIDLTRHMDFLLGNVVKYVARAGRKGNRLEDLQKAAQYLAWAIEDEETK